MMKINWLVISVVAIFVIALLFYIIRKNRKDRIKYARELNEDYKSPYEEESELNDEN